MTKVFSCSTAPKQLSKSSQTEGSWQSRLVSSNTVKIALAAAVGLFVIAYLLRPQNLLDGFGRIGIFEVESSSKYFNEENLLPFGPQLVNDSCRSIQEVARSICKSKGSQECSNAAEGLCKGLSSLDVKSAFEKIYERFFDISKLDSSSTVVSWGFRYLKGTVGSKYEHKAAWENNAKPVEAVYQSICGLFDKKGGIRLPSPWEN